MDVVSSQLSVAIGADAVARVMAERPGDARYFLGVVAWSRGTLAEEIDKGQWQTHPPDAALVLNDDTATLWNRLAPLPRSRNALYDRQHERKR